ncbi:MAG: uroporphyrinogen decarboxylase family protein [Chthonomonadales bacterium]|nr:uroporphyrinogen decarboxylase family protein [Chthonomonadales bacterium]
MTGRERVLSLLDGEPVDRLPCMAITMQFAAARIGRPYLEYATDYRVLAEGQMRVAEEFGLDYVNTMSDPAVEAADCGAAVRYYPDQPPALDESNALLADKAAFARLRVPDPAASSRMSNRLRAIERLREGVGDSLVVEGWIEGPCAEAADLRGINTVMVDFFDDPGFVRDLFDFVVEMELRFAAAQVAAGADVIGIGDAAASLVGPRFYEEFVWPAEKRMVDGVHALGSRVRLHICGNTRAILAPIGQLGCDIVDIDYLAPLAQAREATGPRQVLLGNIDPVSVLRDGSPEAIHEAIRRCHEDAGDRYIVGPGCETTRDTRDANFGAMTAYAANSAP